MQDCGNNSIGIYVRESRDDNGENYETIENQRDLLLDYAQRHQLGKVYAIYTDDNVSGSAFERKGLSRLKEDVLCTRIDLLLLKDLSRLGRNNVKTLQFLDFLEEYGVRILSSDGRYDSLRDNDTVGIETWVNERYVRDLSRKIRSCLRFKIQRGEYLGNAPFGYRKADGEKNRLCPDEAEAETVRMIYRLYRSGMGYTAIAFLLDERGCPSPGSDRWNRITVRRILCSRVYIGDTVQGVSEKISFKSKKTRRLPQDEWVITEGTHEAIISADEFQEVQRLREYKGIVRTPNKGVLHTLKGLVWCGGCGSVMYARKRAAGLAYVCGNYFRNGKSACTSHFVYDEVMVKCICNELVQLFSTDDYLEELLQLAEASDLMEKGSGAAVDKVQKQLAVCRRQQEILYMDRLGGRISEQLFIRINRGLEDRLKAFEVEFERMTLKASDVKDIGSLINEVAMRAESGQLTNEQAKLIVNKITVYDPGDRQPLSVNACDDAAGCESGTILIDFKIHIGV